MLAFQRILFGALVAVQRPVLSFTSFCAGHQRSVSDGSILRCDAKCPPARHLSAAFSTSERRDAASEHPFHLPLEGVFLPPSEFWAGS